MGLEKILGSSKSSLLLLHPTSLPDPQGNKYGVGELGSEAFRFVDFLAEAGILAWQVLPLGHTGYGNSPYQTFSRFAGSPYMISVEKLLEKGDISQEEHDNYVKKVVTKDDNTDFGWLFDNKLGFNRDSEAVLRKAFKRFNEKKTERFDDFGKFCKEESYWLDDYAEFMGLKENNGQRHWEEWDARFRIVGLWKSKREEVISADKNLKDSIQFYRYLQFVFFEQWNDLKSYSKTKGRKIIGDIPFYVGYDSSDVWANSKAFQFDKEGKPSFVSGVPPDYFSATGQLWGSPVYEWEEEQCFEWWLKSLQHLLRVADMIRIDHFRAVDSFWKIPYKVALSEKTAVKGVWSKGPGKELFRRIKEYLVQSKLLEENSQLPFIAEDLGFLDPLYATVKSYPESFSKDKKFKVDKKFREMIRSKHLGLGLALDHVTGEYSTRKGVGLVLEEFSIPYMLVLQFGMSGDFRSRPENVPSNCVYYSGTHDNDTIKGWYDSSDKSTIDNYLSNSEEFQKTKSLINGVLEMLYSSNACLAGVPFQDLLDLGSEARMNLPSNMKEGGWWTWRATKSQLDYSKIANLLSNLAKKYRRFC